MKLLNQGYQPVDVARMVGVDRRSVRRWKASHRKHGDQALKFRPVSGRPPKLGIKQKVQVERGLLKGAKAAGFPTDLWTCPRVAQYISKRFGINYHEDHIGRLLRSMGGLPGNPNAGPLNAMKNKSNTGLKGLEER